MIESLSIQPAEDIGKAGLVECSGSS